MKLNTEPAPEVMPDEPHMNGQDHDDHDTARAHEPTPAPSATDSHTHSHCCGEQHCTHNHAEVKDKDNNVAEASSPPETEPESAAFTITVMLPKECKGQSLSLPLLPSDSIRDVRHFVAEKPHAYPYTSFYFEFNGERLHNEYMIVSEIAELVEGSELHMVKQDYNDRAVRIHVRRLQDLLRPADQTVERTGSVKPMSSYYAPSLTHSIIKEESPSISENSHGLDEIEPKLQEIYGGTIITETPPKCLTSLAYSGWHPPPGNRKLKGEVAYLRVVTRNNIVAHVVCHSSGFYISRSTDDSFLPQESDRPCRSDTLVGTLSQFCTVFKAQYNSLIYDGDRQGNKDLTPTPERVRSWMITKHTHDYDEMRAGEAGSSWSESDPQNPGIIRDWNEDFQVSFELPNSHASEILLRERVLYKFNLDYVKAARTGARATVLGNLPPMNPGDVLGAQMYIWNNMLLSFASNDRGAYTALGGDEAAHIAANNDLRSVRKMSELGDHGLSILATVLVDYMGHRVITQSILPGILRIQQTSAIKYGVNDEEKTLAVDPEFSARLQSMSAKLQCKEHQVKYQDGNTYTLNSSSETKGILSTDGRLYVLDLTRTTPVDYNFVEPSLKESDSSEAPYFEPFGNLQHDETTTIVPKTWKPRHNLSLLRKELVELFTIKKASSNDKNSSDAGPIETKFNLDVFTNIDVVGTDDELRKDKDLVIEAGEFLYEQVIPTFVANLASLRHSPVDGQDLTTMMHARGINMRYLGMIITELIAVQSPDKLMHPVVIIASTELLARALKHRLRAVMKSTSVSHMADVVARFLNCVTMAAVGKKKGNKKKKAATVNTDLTPQRVWTEVTRVCAVHFRTLIVVSNSNSHLRVGTGPNAVLVSKLALLRSLCKKTGVQMLARKYHLDCLSNPHFTSEDIMDIIPVCKHMEPASTEGKKLYEEGTLLSRAGYERKAADFLERAVQTMQQTYGLMHESIANCYRQLAVVFGKTKQFNFAISYQSKAVLTSEGARGSDHPETIQDIIYLGQFMRLGNRREKALRLFKYARHLCTVAVGEYHQEHALIDTHIGLCYLELRQATKAVTWFDRALKCQKEVLPDSDISCAQTNILKATALAQAHNAREALACARIAYTIYSDKLGDDHPKSKETFSLVRQFVKNAVIGEEAKKRLNGVGLPNHMTKGQTAVRN